MQIYQMVVDGLILDPAHYMLDLTSDLLENSIGYSETILFQDHGNQTILLSKTLLVK